MRIVSAEAHALENPSMPVPMNAPPWVAEAVSRRLEQLGIARADSRTFATLLVERYGSAAEDRLRATVARLRIEARDAVRMAVVEHCLDSRYRLDRLAQPQIAFTGGGEW
jgi:hypothetical protein